MADATDPTSGGEEAFAYLITEAIPLTVERMMNVERTARATGMTTIAEGAATIITGLLDDVNRIAVEMAGASEGLIVKHMFQTQSRNRPLTGNMESHVRSLPGPLGTVRVAMIDELDKIVNPQGYGAFWMAQEFGTGKEGEIAGRSIEVPQQEGRVLLGAFEPSGEHPDEQQRGLGAGHDLAFVSGGSDPGFGTITEELPGRHFLRDGSLEAGSEYLVMMRGVRDKWDARINALAQAARREVQRGGSYTAIIEA